MGEPSFSTTSVRVVIPFFIPEVSSEDIYRFLTAVAHPTIVKPINKRSKNFFS